MIKVKNNKAYTLKQNSAWFPQKHRKKIVL